VKLRRVTRHQEAHLWPLVADRIAAFSRSFGAEPSAFVSNLWTLFATTSPLCGVWAMLDDQDHVVGHAVTTIEAWNGAHVAWIHQCKNDRPAPKDLMEAWLADVEAWVADANRALAPSGIKVTDLMFITTRETEAWCRRVGFDRHRIVYRRAIRSS
jgi:hypothetical protein